MVLCSLRSQAETSLVYDKDGNLISTLKGEKDVYYIGLQDIPTETIELMISIEDKKFYQHRGLDFKAIARAAWALIENKGEKPGSVKSKKCFLQWSWKNSIPRQKSWNFT